MLSLYSIIQPVLNMAKSNMCKLCLMKPSLSNNMFFKNLALTFVMIIITLFIIQVLWFVSRHIFKKFFVDNIENLANMDNMRLSTRQFSEKERKIIQEVRKIEEEKRNPPVKYEYTTEDLDLNLKGKHEIPTINGIPSSNVLEVDMKKPWSPGDKEAVQIPQYNVCRNSILDGKRFCGIPASNAYTIFDFKS